MYPSATPATSPKRRQDRVVHPPFLTPVCRDPRESSLTFFGWKGSDVRVGYVRVSSGEQNTVRQLDGIDVERIFTDKASGKDTARPQLD